MSSPDPGSPLAPYDAVLLVSFGGPEAPEEVQPFLEHVTAGRVPADRLAEVAQHYLHFGGRSPINDQCRALIAALQLELGARGSDVPIYWGNRHSAPWLNDTMAQIAEDGHRRVLVLTTSAYPSYSGCRSYREELFDAVDLLNVNGALTVDRVRHYAQHPGFVQANVDAIVAALATVTGASIPEEAVRVIFVTHSIPDAMAETSGPRPRSAVGGYVDWHRAVAGEIVWRLRRTTGHQFEADLAYCSRSGPPNQPWLEPDINDRLTELAAEGVQAVVLAPIGFISDHMEVVFDLDTEAAQTASELGLRFARASTVGTHPGFVSALADVLEERARMALDLPVAPAVIDGGSPGLVRCQVDCCPNLRQPDRPALGQAS